MKKAGRTGNFMVSAQLRRKQSKFKKSDGRIRLSGVAFPQPPYNRRCVLVSDFHYELPDDLIAQQPLPDRAGSRLLQLSAANGAFADRQFSDFPELLRP